MTDLLVRVRPGTVDDIEFEAAINKAEGWCFDDLEILAEYHDDAYEPSTLLIAEVDGGTVGKLELFLGWKAAYERFGLIRRFAVVEGHRGQGIGKSLLNAAIERARQAGCAFVELSVDVTNPAAHAFYRREGFVEDRVEVVMRRPLDDAGDGSRSGELSDQPEL